MSAGEREGTRVAVIDYEMGNLFSVRHACRHVGLNAFMTSNGKDILRADAAILPGVGAFGKAMGNLVCLDMVSPIKEFIASGKPFMGICLGMQLLFSESEEFGVTSGLNVVEGRIVKFPPATDPCMRVKVPHIGWSRVSCPREKADFWKRSPLSRVPSGAHMYFVHSFYPIPEDKEIILSFTTYGETAFCSCVMKDNLFATQFHPEKSAALGLQIYSQWGSLVRGMAARNE